MTNLHETYTFTARDAENPDKVVTFTLHNNHARVNLTGLIDRVGTVAQATTKTEEAGKQISAQTQPALLKLADSLSGPVHINDMSADLDGDRFKVITWRRAAGLRLAPVNIHINHVDNPTAAEAFIDELEQRQTNASHPGTFSGPLDYWFGWLALALAVSTLLIWPRKKAAQNNNQ